MRRMRFLNDRRFLNDLSLEGFSLTFERLLCDSTVSELAAKIFFCRVLLGLELVEYDEAEASTSSSSWIEKGRA